MKQKFLLTIFSALSMASLGNANTLEFSGYTWEVRPNETSGGPGPNRWSQNNAFVDAAGQLHLQITERGGRWYCSEVYLQAPLGFGTYTFTVRGRVDLLDPNVVLGLFNYTTPDIGPDGTNEIDIELARWGNPANPNDNFTVFPAIVGPTPVTQAFPIVLRGAGLSTHRFTWTPTSVFFQSFAGSSSGPLLASWLYQPAHASVHIPQNPIPVHMNLWLDQGQPPTNGQPVEVIIQSFSFTPM